MWLNPARVNLERLNYPYEFWKLTTQTLELFLKLRFLDFSDLCSVGIFNRREREREKWGGGF